MPEYKTLNNNVCAACHLTKFTHIVTIDHNGEPDGISKTDYSPDTYDEIIWLGKWGRGKDVFMCRVKGANTFAILYGHKGSEFENNA